MIDAVKDWNGSHRTHSQTILIGSYQVGAIHGFWTRSDLAAILVLFTVRCLAQAYIPLFNVCFLFPWLSHSCLFQSRWNSLGFSLLVACHLPPLLRFLPSCWALNRSSLGWAEVEPPNSHLGGSVGKILRHTAYDSRSGLTSTAVQWKYFNYICVSFSHNCLVTCSFHSSSMFKIDQLLWACAFVFSRMGIIEKKVEQLQFKCYLKIHFVYLLK